MATLLHLIVCIALGIALAVHAVVEIIKAYIVCILGLLLFVAVAVPLVMGIQYTLTLLG